MSTTTSANSADLGIERWESAPLSKLTEHIVETHHSFLRTQLPRIRERLDRILGKKPEQVCGFVPSLGKTFNALQEELEAHLMKEEQILFPMIARMEAAIAAGQPLPGNHCGSVQAPIRQMEFEHSNGKSALAEMRQLTNGYPLEEGMCKNRRGLFEDLLALEADLTRHIQLEEETLHRRAVAMERAGSADTADV